MFKAYLNMQKKTAVWKKCKGHTIFFGVVLKQLIVNVISHGKASEIREASKLGNTAQWTG